jgi:8-oxo-dGTP diphosphatase
VSLPQRQFGVALPGRRYRPRWGAHGILPREDGLALVFIHDEGYLDLPGGAVDPGETLEDALIREFREEAGLQVRPAALLGMAGQYAELDDGRSVNKVCGFYLVREVAPAVAIAEPDHELVTRGAELALTHLEHEAHAWAVMVWLRQARRRSFAL